MSVVIEPCAMVDLNLSDQDPRYAAVSRIIEEETCYVAPIALSEVYRRIQKDISDARAEMMLKAALSNTFMVVVGDYDEDLIRSLIAIRNMGISYVVAHSAALSGFLGYPVLTNEPVYDERERQGYCAVRHY